jgi:hypothetical protein
MLLQTYIQNKASLLSEEDQKSRREEENMLVPALAKKKTLLSASSEFGMSQYSVFCPTRKVKESSLSIRRRRLRHSHEAGYV